MFITILFHPLTPMEIIGPASSLLAGEEGERDLTPCVSYGELLLSVAYTIMDSHPHLIGKGEWQLSIPT